MLSIQPIQFGDFPIIDSTSAYVLQESINKLQQEKIELTNTFLEKEHQIQKEKDDFTFQMSLLMIKKTTEYQELFDKYKILEDTNATLHQDIDNLKNTLTVNSHDFDDFKRQNDVVCANYQKIIEDLSKSTTTLVPPRMVSVGVECNIKDDVHTSIIKRMRKQLRI
jgi:hypothetical protein